MDEMTLQIGDIVAVNEIRYRVIGYQKGFFSLCQMDISRIKIVVLSAMDLISDIQNKAVLVERRASDGLILDMRMMDNNIDFQKKRELVRFVTREYGPMYVELCNKKPKPALKEEMERNGIEKDAAWRVIRRYLQSGLDEASIMDGRVLRSKKRGPYKHTKKSGRPADSALGKGVPLTEEVKSYFDEAIKDYLSGRAKTKKSAYSTMIEKHYTVFDETNTGVRVRILPENQRPTLVQFQNYSRETISQEELDRVKTSAREQRNNKRLLTSDNLQGVMGPGDLWEVDECEMDISLVSTEDPTLVVGRPILYVMVDVYTRMIVSYSISFDNNSIRGITNCLLSLLEDKKELCARFGVSIGSEEWPSKIIPLRLRSDYGSEYLSHEMDKICVELGIAKELVTPATGSLKGQVEQVFHQIHSAQNPIVESKGLIEKRHDSQHHKEATLNIHEFESMILPYIVAHNRKYMENYPMTRDMRVQKVQPVPIELWKYGVEKNGNPRPVTNESMFRYALLQPVKASVGRSGITFKGLSYINSKDNALMREMYLAQSNGKIKLESARIDVRKIDHLYYQRDGKLMVATLNFNKTGMKDYAGLSLPEYEALRKEKKKNDALGREENLKLDIAVQSRQKAVLKNAKGANVQASPEGLRDSREKEKLRRSQEMLVFPEEKRLPTEPHTISETEAPTKCEPKVIGMISAEDALRMFNEETEFEE